MISSYWIYSFLTSWHFVTQQLIFDNGIELLSNRRNRAHQLIIDRTIVNRSERAVATQQNIFPVVEMLLLAGAYAKAMATYTDFLLLANHKPEPSCQSFSLLRYVTADRKFDHLFQSGRLRARPDLGFGSTPHYVALARAAQSAGHVIAAHLTSRGAHVTTLDHVFVESVTRGVVETDARIFGCVVAFPGRHHFGASSEVMKEKDLPPAQSGDQLPFIRDGGDQLIRPEVSAKMEFLSDVNWGPGAFRRRRPRGGEDGPALDYTIVTADVAKYYDFTSPNLDRAEWFWYWTDQLLSNQLSPDQLPVLPPRTQRDVIINGTAPEDAYDNDDETVLRYKLRRADDKMAAPLGLADAHWLFHGAAGKRVEDDAVSPFGTSIGGGRNGTKSPSRRSSFPTVANEGEGRWGHPFIDCELGKIWLIPYSVPIYMHKTTFVGVIAILFDMRYMNIDQCDNGTGIFAGSHLCDISTQCFPLKSQRNSGFSYGNYVCKCKNAFDVQDIENAMVQKVSVKGKRFPKEPRTPPIPRGRGLSLHPKPEGSGEVNNQQLDSVAAVMENLKQPNVRALNEYYSLIPKSYYDYTYSGLELENAFTRDLNRTLVLAAHNLTQAISTSPITTTILTTTTIESDRLIKMESFEELNSLLSSFPQEDSSLHKSPTKKSVQYYPFHRSLYDLSRAVRHLYQGDTSAKHLIESLEKNAGSRIDFTRIAGRLELGAGVYRAMAWDRTYLDRKFGNGSAGDHVTPHSDSCLSCGGQCVRCPGRACFARYSIGMRGPPLAIQSFCMTLATALAILIFRTRKIKMICIAMWTLLEVIILGALILYSTVIVNYFRPTTVLCFLEPWLREIGFGLLYGAIILKLYRIYVDFQSRKAHRVHIRDKDLLKYLLGIVIVLIGYMAAWTFVNLDRISEEGGSMLEVGITNNRLLYFVCKSLWWDYVIEIGEFLFLMFGLYFCWRVRSVRSQFNEVWALKTSLCIESVVSLICNLVRHIFLLKTNPDFIFLLYFLRSQLTVTVVLILIFMPKVWRLMNIKNYVDRRNRGVSNADGLDHVTPEAIKLRDNMTSNGDLDFNDISISDMDPEEIRSELKRVYVQLQMLKNKNLRKDNPHISKRRGGRKVAHSRRFSLQAFHPHPSHSQPANSSTPGADKEFATNHAHSNNSNSNAIVESNTPPKRFGSSSANTMYALLPGPTSLKTKSATSLPLETLPEVGDDNGGRQYLKKPSSGHLFEESSITNNTTTTATNTTLQATTSRSNSPPLEITPTPEKRSKQGKPSGSFKNVLGKAKAGLFQGLVKKKNSPARAGPKAAKSIIKRSDLKKSRKHISRASESINPSGGANSDISKTPESSSG